MALGNKSRMVFLLTNQAQITGGGSNADVTGNHFRLPCKAILEDVDFSASAISTTTTTAAVITLYAGTTKSGTAMAAGTLSDTVPRADGTITAGLEDTIFAANQEFCIAENTTSGETIDGLVAVCTFREAEG